MEGEERRRETCSLVFGKRRGLFYLRCRASCLEDKHTEASLEAGFYPVNAVMELCGWFLHKNSAAVFKEKAKHNNFLEGQKSGQLAFSCPGSMI